MLRVKDLLPQHISWDTRSFLSLPNTGKATALPALSDLKCRPLSLERMRSGRGLDGMASLGELLESGHHVLSTSQKPGAAPGTFVGWMGGWMDGWMSFCPRIPGMEEQRGTGPSLSSSWDPRSGRAGEQSSGAGHILLQIPARLS